MGSQHTAVVTDTAIQINGTVGSDIVQGLEQGNRTGAAILLKSVRWQLRVNNQMTTQDGYIRFLCLKRKEPTAGYNKLFTSRGVDVQGVDYLGLVGDSMQIMAPINRTLFTTVVDKKFRVLRKNPASMGRDSIYKTITKRFKHKIRYDIPSGNPTGHDEHPNLKYFMFYQADDGSDALSYGYELDTYTRFEDV